MKARALRTVVGGIVARRSRADIRRRGRRRCPVTARELLGEGPILVDESANYFGRRSAGRFQVRGNGCLALGDDQLVFVMWLPRRALAIRRQAITAVDTADSHLGKRVGRPLLRVAFDEDVAAWWVHDVDRWLATPRLTGESAEAAREVGSD